MPTLPKKLLVANRGEIAVRIMRTCRGLGIGTVAVYSVPDTRSLHVKVADESVALGGFAASESYLVKERIIEAAQRSGSDAIHPGYGFLSENPDFARMVVDAGLVYVGPPAKAMAIMGDKIAAKKLAIGAGVPTVPGHESPITETAAALEVASDIGYPVLLKPAAGGGGKGMRIVTAADEMEASLAACKGEATKAFGDDRIFVERYVARPRHVEIQILADSHGAVMHLGERECSIQRRYQKIVEEAPSLAVDTSLRKRMGAAACDLARAAGYVNAGTVEFILDEDGQFYFLEMNTRLQVEHPVTEMVTGLDLVELQLRIAAGEPLPQGHAGLETKGWAIEARVCAEDPERGFMPSTGPITRHEAPRGHHVRVDSGIEAGSTVSVHYDSMLAKVVAWGDTREEARSTLVDALNGYHIEGLSTNIDFVNAVLNHAAFIEGALSTNFVAEHMGNVDETTPAAMARLRYMAIAVVLVHYNRESLVVESLKPMSPTVGGVKTPADQRHYFVKAGGDVFEVDLAAFDGKDRWTVVVDGEPHEVITPSFEFYRRRLKLKIDGHSQRFLLRYEGSFIRAAHDGIRRTFEVYTPREYRLARFMPEPAAQEDSDSLVCPMPGLVVSVLAAEGDRVHAGEVLLILESMKMETGVPAPRDAEVRSVLVSKGQAVEAGDTLIEFVP